MVPEWMTDPDASEQEEAYRQALAAADARQAARLRAARIAGKLWRRSRATCSFDRRGVIDGGWPNPMLEAGLDIQVCSMLITLNIPGGTRYHARARFDDGTTEPAAFYLKGRTIQGILLPSGRTRSRLDLIYQIVPGVVR